MQIRPLIMMVSLNFCHWIMIHCLMTLCMSSPEDLRHLLLRELISNTGQRAVTQEQTSVGDYVMIGAFNIRMFGTAKASNPEVMDTLVKILSRYDLVLVQEIRDESGKAIENLLALLNGAGEAFNMSLSERLGRSYSKEQYAYLYRPEKLQFIHAEVYADRDDQFEREPYVALFSYTDGIFGVVGIHTKPDAAESEIDALVEVYDYYSELWKHQDFIMMGDFNADCSYVTSSEWSTVRLRSDQRFVWLIDNDLDTTTSATHCAYDRIVIAGSQMRKMIDPGSAVSFEFDKAYGLTQKQALDVSDHFPVECKLYLKVGEQSITELERIHFSQSISVQNTHGPTLCPLSNVQSLFDQCATDHGYQAVLDFYDKDTEMDFSISEIPEKRYEDVFTLLDCISSRDVICKGLLSQVSQDLLRINLNAGAFSPPQELPGIHLSTGAFVLEIQFKFIQGYMPYQIILTRKTEYEEDE